MISESKASIRVNRYKANFKQQKSLSPGINRPQSPRNVKLIPLKQLKEQNVQSSQCLRTEGGSPTPSPPKKQKISIAPKSIQTTNNLDRTIEDEENNIYTVKSSQQLEFTEQKNIKNDDLPQEKGLNSPQKRFLEKEIQKIKGLLNDCGDFFRKDRIRQNGYIEEALSKVNNMNSQYSEVIKEQVYCKNDTAITFISQFLGINKKSSISYKKLFVQSMMKFEKILEQVKEEKQKQIEDLQQIIKDKDDSFLCVQIHNLEEKEKDSIKFKELTELKIKNLEEQLNTQNEEIALLKPKNSDILSLDKKEKLSIDQLKEKLEDFKSAKIISCEKIHCLNQQNKQCNIIETLFAQILDYQEKSMEKAKFCNTLLQKMTNQVGTVQIPTNMMQNLFEQLILYSEELIPKKNQEFEQNISLFTIQEKVIFFTHELIDAFPVLLSLKSHQESSLNQKQNKKHSYLPQIRASQLKKI